MINFQDVHIEGFGSIQNLTFPFKKGLNIIKADNGMGKTTIFNAWFWSLTGQTLKPNCSITTWDHVRPLDYKGTKVINNFNDGEHQYQIIRCQDYIGKVEGAKGNNRLILKRDGEIVKNKKKQEIQNTIIKILGYTPDLLKNTLVFGQKLKRLIDESGTNKKDILEQAFEMYFIQEAQDKAKKHKQEKLKKYGPIELKYETIKMQLQGKKELLSQALESEVEFEIKKEKRIKELEDEIKEAEKDLSLKQGMNSEEDLKSVGKQIFTNNQELIKFRKQEIKYESHLSEYNLLVSQIEELKKKIKKLNGMIEEIELILEKPIKKCDRCKQAVSGVAKKEVKEGLKQDKKKLSEEKQEYSNQLNIINSKLKSIKRQLASLKQVKDSITTIENNNKKLERNKEVINKGLNEIQQHEKSLNKLKEDLKLVEEDSLVKKSTKIKLDIRRLKKKIKPIKLELKGLRRELEVLEWLIKDPLSNSGLKAFIFNDMIHILNERMSVYSKYFGFTVKFDVNMESARKDIDAYIFQEDEIIPYSDLSGGEGQFVSVIMAFALHDIVAKGHKATNLLLMDEIFENLSKINIEKVNDIIQDKLGNLSVYLITHRNEFNPYNSNIIRLKKQLGHTLVETSH